jgi:hypothetical protein
MSPTVLRIGVGKEKHAAPGDRVFFIEGLEALVLGHSRFCVHILLRA